MTSSGKNGLNIRTNGKEVIYIYKGVIRFRVLRSMCEPFLCIISFRAYQMYEYIMKSGNVKKKQCIFNNKFALKCFCLSMTHTNVFSLHSMPIRLTLFWLFRPPNPKGYWYLLWHLVMPSPAIQWYHSHQRGFSSSRHSASLWWFLACSFCCSCGIVWSFPLWIRVPAPAVGTPVTHCPPPHPAVRGTRGHSAQVWQVAAVLLE